MSPDVTIVTAYFLGFSIVRVLLSKWYRSVLKELFLDTPGFSLLVQNFEQHKIQWQSINRWKAIVRLIITERGSGKVQGSVANVGRYDPNGQRTVGGWDRDDGNDNVFAVPVIVSRIKI